MCGGGFCYEGCVRRGRSGGGGSCGRSAFQLPTGSTGPVSRADQVLAVAAGRGVGEDGERRPATGLRRVVSEVLGREKGIPLPPPRGDGVPPRALAIAAGVGRPAVENHPPAFVLTTPSDHAPRLI